MVQSEIGDFAWPNRRVGRKLGKANSYWSDLRKWHNLVGSNLLFASEVIQSDVSCEALAKREGVSMSETVTAHAVRVGEKLKDGPRGGSAARSLRRQDFGGQANDNGKRVGSQKTQVNRALSRLPRASRGRPASSAGRSSDNRSAFIPILPADISAGHGPDSAFHFLGSKTDPILHVQYPSPWNLVADFAAKRGENLKNSNWRRGRDSNPQPPAYQR